MKLRDHQNLRDKCFQQPPTSLRPGSTFLNGHEDVVEQVSYLSPNGPQQATVVLVTRFRGKRYTRCIPFEDARFAEKLYRRFQQAVGRTFQEIEQVEID